MDEDDLCKHLLTEGTCRSCKPLPKTTFSRGADLTRAMHLLLKWNPDHEVDTCDQHRAHAGSQGSTWWSCDTESETRAVAPKRLERITAQRRGGKPTSAFLYRTGDAPADAEVWRAEVVEATDDEALVDPALRPPHMRASSGFLFVKLTDFEAVPPGWVLEHLEHWDEPGKAVDAGGLRTQTSPFYVAER
jgi:hypothetical protein